MPDKTLPEQHTVCYHCGDTCGEPIVEEGKPFCCQGCRQVYALLQENGLCTYYDFDKNPGIKARGKFVHERFAYLDDETVIARLAQFRSDQLIHVHFALPQMHCASCIYLLENLHRINPGVIRSRADFQKKQVFVSFNPKLVTLRQVVELLAFIGYEPQISLKDVAAAKTPNINRRKLFHLGVAGFSFANIMMLSFPEYFSGGYITEHGLKEVFAWVIFGLSLPVLFYASSSIFESAWKGLRQKDINIDVPIALAIVITFGRSYYEIITGTGAGYLDSGTGIIFFMLVGRWFQGKTHDALSFDRDYQSYFPLGVTVIRNNREENIPATRLEVGERIIVRNGEMIPSDAILLEGRAMVDYSFVSGENVPVECKAGDLLYAGGRQAGGAIELKVAREVSQSYITQLWNNDVFTKDQEKLSSFIHPWSRYFTMALFTVAISAAVYWWLHNPAMIWPVVTSVLIVACPCSLLLSATFTFGNMLRHFGRHKMYLKNEKVVEALAAVDTIVFDKTGTITVSDQHEVSYAGQALTETDKRMIRSLAGQSAHTLSRFLFQSLHTNETDAIPVLSHYQELSGQGIRALVDEVPVRLGSAEFIPAGEQAGSGAKGARVYVQIGNQPKGYFEIRQQYRPGMEAMAVDLLKMGYELSVLSGDHDAERSSLEKIFGKGARMQFEASPQDKLAYIKNLQASGRKVLMIGDGLNDAGALKQADAGIAVTDHAARFTPASDVILDGGSVYKLNRFLKYARSGKTIIAISFIVSILYNIVGLSFAVQGLLSPLVAAILMPASSISIIILVSLLGNYMARWKGLYKN